MLSRVTISVINVFARLPREPGTVGCEETRVRQEATRRDRRGRMLEGGSCCTQTRARQHKHKTPTHSKRYIRSAFIIVISAGFICWYRRHTWLEFHPGTLRVLQKTSPRDLTCCRFITGVRNLTQISLIGSLESFQSRSAVLRLPLFCHFTQKMIPNNNNPSSSSLGNWAVSLWFGEPPAARLKLMQCGSCDYAAWFINSTRDFKTNNKTRASCAARWEKRQTTSNQSPPRRRWWWWWWKPVVFAAAAAGIWRLVSPSRPVRRSAAPRRDFLLNSPLCWLRRQETRRLGRQAWFFFSPP